MQIRLREKWPWNKEFLRLFLVVPSLLGIIATVILYPMAGIQSLWFLTAVSMGILFYLIYGYVGRSVDKLRLQLQDKPGELAESLLVVGKIQSPGFVRLRQSEIELIPIIGERIIIPMDKILSIKSGNCLPGKFVWGKRAFILDTTLSQRLAFAVPESIGRQWSLVLSPEK